MWQLFSSKLETPFVGADQAETFSKIKAGKFEDPDLATPEVADLIRQLLVVSPEGRLGSDLISDLKEHALFRSVDFDTLFSKFKAAPLAPH